MYEFEIFKYSCNLYLSNGVDCLKLVNIKDCFPHPVLSIFGVGYDRTDDIKN
jgi:hypothetical protein